MVIAVTIGRSPASSTAERITLFCDAGLNEDLREPGAEHDDDHGAGILNAAGLDDLLLNVFDANARDRRPKHGQYQQHDDRTLSADDQYDDRKKCNEQRNACPKVHCLSSPAYRPFLVNGLCVNKSGTRDCGWRAQHARACGRFRFRAPLSYCVATTQQVVSGTIGEFWSSTPAAL